MDALNTRIETVLAELLRAHPMPFSGQILDHAKRELAGFSSRAERANSPLERAQNELAMMQIGGRYGDLVIAQHYAWSQPGQQATWVAVCPNLAIKLQKAVLGPALCLSTGPMAETGVELTLHTREGSKSEQHALSASKVRVRGPKKLLGDIDLRSIRHLPALVEELRCGLAALDFVWR